MKCNFKNKFEVFFSLIAIVFLLAPSQGYCQLSYEQVRALNGEALANALLIPGEVPLEHLSQLQVQSLTSVQVATHIGNPAFPRAALSAQQQAVFQRASEDSFYQNLRASILGVTDTSENRQAREELRRANTDLLKVFITNGPTQITLSYLNFKDRCRLVDEASALDRASRSELDDLLGLWDDDIARNENGTPKLMTHRAAKSYCRRKGLVLPNLIDASLMGEKMGAQITPFDRWDDSEGVYLHEGNDDLAIGYFSTGFKPTLQTNFSDNTIWLKDSCDRNATRSIPFYTFNGTTGKIDLVDSAEDAIFGDESDDEDASYTGEPMRAVRCIAANDKTTLKFGDSRNFKIRK